MRLILTGRAVVAASAFVVIASSGFAQVPWDTFSDPLSSSVCDVVNAANAELVVLSETGFLTIVTGPDVILEDLFADTDGNVFYFGESAGFLEFAEDGDGFRTLWWVSNTGRVVEVDDFTSEPLVSDLFPDDFFDVPCDACGLWDDPTTCQLDEDGDGILDAFDDCPFTPIDEFADDFGCSCSQLDDDLDGVENCIDLCPNTPLTDDVNSLGCTRSGSGPIILCGGFSGVSLAMMFFGLGALRFRSRGI